MNFRAAILTVSSIALTLPSFAHAQGAPVDSGSMIYRIQEEGPSEQFLRQLRQPMSPEAKKKIRESLKSVFELKCTVTDERGNEHDIMSLPKQYFNRKSGAATVEKSFRPDGCDRDLTLKVWADEEDHLVYVTITDEEGQTAAETAADEPRKLYVFLGTRDYSVSATCDFTPMIK